MIRTTTRRMSVVAAVSLAAFILTGCASAATSSTTSTSGATLDYAGPGPSSPEAAAVVTAAGNSTSTDWCGTKKITVGVADAFGANGWSKNSYAAVRSELAKCSNVTQLVTSGQGDLTKSISDINGLVAQGAKAIVVLASFGQAELPAIQSATRAGVSVVPWAGPLPGATIGTDIVANVGWSPEAAGETWMSWISKHLNGTGNVVYLGGPAGNAQSQATLDGVVKVAGKNAGLTILNGDSSFPATNWDPATAQSVMASLLAKYPKIDGLIVDDGASAAGALRAFTAAGRSMPIVATLEANVLACAYQDTKKTNPELEVATMSARNWMGRVAARKAVAAAQGLPNNDPSLYFLPIYEDSYTSQAPQCDTSLSPDTYFSNQISASDLAKYGSAN